jgi:GNAT superfamily N-acetyltransferase
VGAWLGIGDPAATWPQVFGRFGDARSFGTFVRGRLASHVAVRRVVLQGAAGPVRASLLGSVATDPELRGLGLASQLVAAVRDAERDTGQELALLWSERHAFFARIGFTPLGTQTELEVFAASDEAVRPATIADLPAILALHELKPWRVVRDLGELALLLSARGIATFVRERQGRITAYACLGKGADFAGWWHELGGCDDDLAALLPAATRALGLTRATVIVPPYRDELADLVGAAGARWQGAGALGLRLRCGADTPFFVDGLDSI